MMNLVKLGGKFLGTVAIMGVAAFTIQRMSGLSREVGEDLAKEFTKVYNSIVNDRD